MSMASPAIVSNFFEKQWTQDHPRYISGLSRALYPTTFLEIAVAVYMHNNKEHNGRPVNRSRDHCCPDKPGALECTEQACIRRALHANFETTSLPPHKQRTNTSTQECSVTQCSLGRAYTHKLYRCTSDSNTFSIKLCDATICMALRLFLYRLVHCFNAPPPPPPPPNCLNSFTHITEVR